MLSRLRTVRSRWALLAITVVAWNVLTGAGVPANGTTPGGNGRIAFASNVSGVYQIYAMDPDGSDQTKIGPDGMTASDPAWSPDGTKIAFDGSGIEPSAKRDVYVMSSDGTGVTRITDVSSMDCFQPALFEPAWSSDGNKIAYSGCGEFADLFTSSPDGANQHRVGSGADASWSPDGSELAYAWSLLAPPSIYVIRADGTHSRKLTPNTSVDSDPVWSPDGTRIAFVSDSGDDTDVYVMNADCTDRTDLTPDSTADDADPAWSPDGRQIAFVETTSGNGDVFVMDADGSNRTRLTSSPSDETHPDWESIDATPSSSPPPVPRHVARCIVHARAVSLGRDGGKVHGKVLVDDGYEACRSHVRVKIERTRSGSSTIVADGSTDARGHYELAVSGRGRYSAVAPRQTIARDVCARAAS